MEEIRATGSDPYEEAFKLHRYYQGLDEEIRNNGSEAAHSTEILRNSVKPGLYRHFKSSPEKQMHYAVFWVTQVIDDGPFFVDYAALYLPHVGEHGLRKLLSPIGESDPAICDGFLDPIDRPTYRGPRFILLEEHTSEELIAIIKEARQKKS